MLETSQALYKKALELAPSGVHSPVRAFQSVSGQPVFFKKGQGSKLIDEDNKEYVDFCMSWGALLLGHAHKNVIEGLVDQVQKGTHYGTPTEWDVELAELILKDLPFDKIRFVNSGTEAVMTAVRLARGYSKKNKIIKINGSYHGHLDSLLVSAGSGLMTQGETSSLGVTNGTTQDTIVVPYQSKEAIEACFKQYPNDIAAIIIEPVHANSGLFEPSQEYVSFLRDITQKNNSLLIFDEVITGYRLTGRTAQKHFDITADLGTYGKVIGGGLPVGALAGKKEIMDHLAPLGGVYQAGTLSGNPLCMRAGIETLNTLNNESIYDKIESLGQHLDKLMNQLKTEANYPFYYKRINSIFWLCPGIDTEPKNADEITAACTEAFKKIHPKLLEQGIYLSPSVYEVAFLSAAHSKEDLDQLYSALRSL